MKKKFALSLVALASVAVLAACGEVKTGVQIQLVTQWMRKSLKSVSTLKETGAVASYGNI